MGMTTMDMSVGAVTKRCIDSRGLRPDENRPCMLP